MLNMLSLEPPPCPLCLSPPPSPAPLPPFFLPFPSPRLPPDCRFQGVNFSFLFVSFSLDCVGLQQNQMLWRMVGSSMLSHLQPMLSLLRSKHTHYKQNAKQHTQNAPTVAAVVIIAIFCLSQALIAYCVSCVGDWKVYAGWLVDRLID